MNNCSCFTPVLGRIFTLFPRNWPNYPCNMEIYRIRGQILRKTLLSQAATGPKSAHDLPQRHTVWPTYGISALFEVGKDPDFGEFDLWTCCSSVTFFINTINVFSSRVLRVFRVPDLKPHRQSLVRHQSPPESHYSLLSRKFPINVLEKSLVHLMWQFFL